ncbi:NAD(P)/FAD-dependent oxidoreductase [Salisediminibacterium halotolerans]|uniref:Predicted NAD/FAD-binding protein n=1 Tax=Salisediminibacterium halotolerans TaxID=517425 RepID=A0A1H9SX35_9BACI|nr:FAD-dependent oxidoreductase [Salisediminibacterium haloalkalitolerans]SER89466.1 Predicted NAD/FAD-binding protein [Salisediminibacterium haloalkalitolerans]
MNEQRPSQRKIAVIGAGVSGIVASHILQRKYEVHLFEKNDYLGGHTNTIVIPDGPDQGTPVDTGFIVLNDRTYPLFNQFLNQLNVSTRKSEMSFSYFDKRDGFQYKGTNLNSLFAQRKNLLSPSFYKMLSGIKKFSKQALFDLEHDRFQGETLGEYIEKIGINEQGKNRFLIPMGGAIWSSSNRDILDYPAQSFVRFFKNHGLLSFKDIPQWQTVIGGSHAYVHAFRQQFNGQIHLQAEIENVRRNEEHVILRMADGSEQLFDDVILAAHADQSLNLLADATAEEKKWLGTWSYSENHTILHTDTSVLPSLRRAWASWNYVRDHQASAPDAKPVSVSYYMNLLQGLKTAHDYCVTLNGAEAISPEKVIKEIRYRHPVYTAEAIRSQEELPKLNGKNNTYFCGSYFGYGFHEDGVRSGVEVARKMGLDL